MDYQGLWENYIVFYGKIFIQIFLIYFVIYSCLNFIKETKGVRVLGGLSFVLVVFWVLASFFQLEVLSWMLSHIWTVIPFSVMVMFQPELRRAFAQLGTQHRQASGGTLSKSHETINAVTETALYLAKRKIGALIAIERFIGMKNISETGVRINTPLNVPLLETIFYPNTPLHDGGVMIKDGRILAAGCIFPLTKSDEVSISLGTRHRAAIGITDDTDCVAVVVSEETGEISLAHNGRLVRDVTEDRLRRHLKRYLIKVKEREFAPETVAKEKETPKSAPSEDLKGKEVTNEK